MDEFSKDNLLRSWKEISAYLGCDIRTCHRWEHDHGMPVHRAEGGETRSPVFAYKDELDAWFKETYKSSNIPRGTAPANPWLKWVIGGAVILVLAGIYLRLGGRGVRRQPADFKIVGSAFYALDEDDRELWHKDLGVDDLCPTAFYRANFQVIHTDQSNILPVLVMKDINADGDTEVLFALLRVRDQLGEGVIFCWDRKGNELWKFRAGKELVCKTQRFSPDYRIAGFYVHDFNGDGRQEIAVESFNAPDWPCQLAVLDSSGKMIGEFWNAGYLRDLTFHDINGDGREELIVCGVNNEYRGGCLIVFDTSDIRGSSPQSGEFACEGLGPGSMLYYVTVPYTDVSEASNLRVEGLRTLGITGNDWIETTTSNGVRYDFDFGLACIQVDWGHGYESLHDDLVKAGKITSVLGEAYREMLRGGVRYWNGSAWTAKPAMNRR